MQGSYVYRFIKLLSLLPTRHPSGADDSGVWRRRLPAHRAAQLAPLLHPRRQAVAVHPVAARQPHHNRRRRLALSLHPHQAAHSLCAGCAHQLPQAHATHVAAVTIVRAPVAPPGGSVGQRRRRRFMSDFAATNFPLPI
jgi:hypothetical protein